MSMQINTLLKDVREINREFSEGHYRMAKLMYAILGDSDLWMEHGKGYTRKIDFIREQLPFAQATTHKYVCLYRGFKDLKYNKTEALALMDACGWNQVAKEMPFVEKKLTTRQFIKRLKEKTPKAQLAATFHNENELRKFEKILCNDYGMHITESGQRVHLTESLLRMSKGQKVVIKNKDAA